MTQTQLATTQGGSLGHLGSRGPALHGTGALSRRCYAFLGCWECKQTLGNEARRANPIFLLMAMAYEKHLYILPCLDFAGSWLSYPCVGHPRFICNFLDTGYVFVHETNNWIPMQIEGNHSLQFITAICRETIFQGWYSRGYSYTRHWSTTYSAWFSEISAPTGSTYDSTFCGMFFSTFGLRHV